MATNTATLKTFAQQTRTKLISLITTKMQFVLTADTAELRGYSAQLDRLRKEIAAKTEKIVVEEVAYTWFNRVMALRFMDANGYNAPMVVTPAPGQTRPEILQDAMGGSIDEELYLSAEEKLLPEAKLYRKLLVAVCNQKNGAMPFLFERITDYTELLLPDDLLSEQSFVSDIRNGMSVEDCENVELMGWLYQFYIIDRKADAEVKKSKKGGLKSDEQAAATQLFTPHWVVRYMVENSLGKIWMTLHPDSRVIKEMPYYIASPEGQIDPIPEGIRSVQDIRFIDPCMGSGHVLVYAFDLLTKMYEEEGVLHKDIPALILQHNLYGIDIDPRCYQLASFALTMKARAYYSRYLRRTVPPHVIALQKVDRDTIESTGNWPAKSLVWQFENIDTIGSLLKITPEECATIKVESGLFGEAQQVLKNQAEYLSKSYHCVVTNPPYLGKGFGDALKSYVQKEYPDSKADIMATFMERCLEMSTACGKVGMINMHSWMFLSSYENLRKKLIEHSHIESLLHLGPRAFPEIGGEVVQCAAFVLSNAVSEDKGQFIRLVDFGDATLKDTKALEAIKNRSCGWFYTALQKNFEKIPGSPIGYWLSVSSLEIIMVSKQIGEVGIARRGLQTGNKDLFIRLWHEVNLQEFCYPKEYLNGCTTKKWFILNSGGVFRKWIGIYDSVVIWRNNGTDIKKYGKGIIPSEHLYFKECISWNKVTSGQMAFRFQMNGIIPGDASPAFFANDHISLLYILALLNTKITNLFINLFAPTLGAQVGDLIKIPYKNNDSSATVKLVNDNIYISKTDWDSHETSWDFTESELIRLHKTYHYTNVSLESIYSEYTNVWEEHFRQLHTNEEELNRQFIEIYGLQDELTPDVPLKEITILQQGEISIEENQLVWHKDVVIKQFISYLVGCYMGRYSVDKPGLIIASQGQDLSALDLQIEGMEDTPQSTLAIDDDGIIPFIQEEDFFADDMTKRIEEAIKRIFGEAHYNDNLKFINAALGDNLRDYLYKNFYTDHVQMYKKRPIYWLFSSRMGDKKKKGYFKALVYMHRLEPDTLSKLHADYLHPYLNKVEQQLKEAEHETDREGLTQAQKNKALKAVDEIRNKVREVRAFELQLVEMASHRLTLDLDDGVKVNYPKFYPLVEPIKGLESSED
ncbi:MAG: BREX-1 system adenine-specific DNA-methyltransferase PglX [Phocaeicola sp.]